MNETHRIADAEPAPPKSEFVAKLESQWARDNFLCVGLDSDYSRLPAVVKKGAHVSDALFDFNRAIVDATADLACAFKPNAAFYEAQHVEGLEALRRTIDYIHENHPDIPVILDAKRADIGSTNDGYAKAAFDVLHADALTVNPYFGREAIQPFLDRKDKGIIILAKTSNPGSGEFQNMQLKLDTDDFNWAYLYEYIAKQVATEWNVNGNCALVVGATYPEELARVRNLVGDLPILIPGLGKQGGEVEATVRAGMDSRTWGMIINSSRDIIFASDGPDFAEAARSKATDVREAINEARAA